MSIKLITLETNSLHKKDKSHSVTKVDLLCVFLKKTKQNKVILTNTEVISHATRVFIRYK